MSEGGIRAIEEVLQVRPVWVNGGGDLPGQIGAITQAMLAVAAGLCRHVLCIRTVWEASHAALARSGRWAPAGGRATDMGEFRLPYGAASAAQWIALNASHYLHRYKVRREVLGHIAITAREGVQRNPEAIYRDPMTMDDYLSARMISSPFGLYDCDVPCDGAVAVVVSAVDTVADRPTPPVFVEAVGTQILERLSWDQDTLTHLPQSLGPSAHLWTRTELRPTDVDVALLYDGFTFNALSWLEGLGFRGLGEATDFIGDGSTIKLGGALPLNPHGGQLSAGRLHGFGFVREAMLHLRGEAVGRQVEGARVAAVSAGVARPRGPCSCRSSTRPATGSAGTSPRSRSGTTEALPLARRMRTLKEPSDDQVGGARRRSPGRSARAAGRCHRRSIGGFPPQVRADRRIPATGEGAPIDILPRLKAGDSNY